MINPRTKTAGIARRTRGDGWLVGSAMARTIYSVEPPREKKLDFEFGSNETTVSWLTQATSQSAHSVVPEAAIYAAGLE